MSIRRWNQLLLGQGHSTSFWISVLWCCLGNLCFPVSHMATALTRVYRLVHPCNVLNSRVLTKQDILWLWSCYLLSRGKIQFRVVPMSHIISCATAGLLIALSRSHRVRFLIWEEEIRWILDFDCCQLSCREDLVRIGLVWLLALEL